MSVALGAFFAGLVVGQSRFGPQAAALHDAVPRRVLGAVLRLGGHAVQPVVRARAAAAWCWRARDRARRQAARRARDRRAAARHAAARRPPWPWASRRSASSRSSSATLGQELGILPPEGLDALVVAAIVSIALNPLLFRAAAAHRGARDARRRDARAGARRRRRRRCRGRRGRPSPSRARANSRGASSQRCAATRACRCTRSARTSTSSRNCARRGAGIVFGHARRPDVLRAAQVEHARAIVVTNDALAEKMSICIAARPVNPRIAIVVTAGQRRRARVAARVRRRRSSATRWTASRTRSCARSGARSDRRRRGAALSDADARLPVTPREVRTRAVTNGG